jgi:outer membrane protein TolC
MRSPVRKTPGIFICKATFAIAIILYAHSATAQVHNLDYYLNTAISNSPLLSEYQYQVAANGLDSQRLRATYKPQVSGISNNSYAPVINGWGYDAALSNIASVNALINVNQSFVSKKNINTQYRGIALLSDSFYTAKKISEQDLKRTVTAQYITAYGDLQQLNFYREVNTLLKGQDEILKKLTQGNTYKQTDYLTFLVTLKQQELSMKQVQVQFRNDYAQLCYLCGIFDTSAAILEAPDVTLQHLPDASSSVFFQRYRTDSLRLANDISILNYSYHPRVSASANAGYSSSFLYQAYKNFGFSVALNLNVPIYDGHQRTIQENKIKLQINTNNSYKDFFARQYDQQIAMLRQQLAGTESLIGDIDNQIRYSKGLIDVNGKLLETGDAKISDFVIAINNYLTAKNLLTQNTISRLQIINQINYWNR